MRFKIIAATAALACWTTSGFAQEKILAGEPATESRTIAYHEQDVIPLLAEVRYTTMVILNGEKIVAFSCGDKTSWQVDQAQNSLFITPAERGARSNINVVTASGHIYSFAVREVSKDKDAHADLKVFINASDPNWVKAQSEKPLFVSAEDADRDKAAKEAAEAALAQEKQKEQALFRSDVSKAQAQVTNSIRHDYTWDENKAARKSFGLKAMYSLNGFTYIEASPQEAPSVYEVRDGKDSLVNFSLQNGVYVIPKILNDGYLRAGKSKLTFRREANNG